MASVMLKSNLDPTRSKIAIRYGGAMGMKLFQLALPQLQVTTASGPGGNQIYNPSTSTGIPERLPLHKSSATS